MREREDANRTREAGHLDEIQGAVATALMLLPNGPIGFIEWLEPSLHPFLSAPILITDVKKCAIRVRLEAQHCNDLLV